MAKNCNTGRAKEPPDTRVVLYRFPKSARISNRWISFLMDCETEWRKIAILIDIDTCLWKAVAVSEKKQGNLSYNNVEKTIRI